jgi:hypothetical protein
MTYFYGYKRLRRPEDWKGLAGDENWVASHSAQELAFAWQGAGGLPEGIVRAFDRCESPAVHGLKVDVAIVEKPVFLDNHVAPSMTDLMAYAHNASGETVILAVEGKAQEAFGLPIRSWLRGDALQFAAETAARPTRVRRFEFLCTRLGLSVDHECQLRYQLFHRTVSALLEAERYAAKAAVVLVHAFGPHGSSNWTDYQLFLEALGAPSPTPGVVVGPLRLGTPRDGHVLPVVAGSRPRADDCLTRAHAW